MKSTIVLQAPDQADVYVIHGCSRLALRRATGLLGRLRRLRWLAPKTRCGQPMLPLAGSRRDATAVHDCPACAAAGAFDGQNAVERLALGWTAFYPDMPHPRDAAVFVDEASVLLNGPVLESDTADLLRQLGRCRSLLLVPPERHGRVYWPTNTRSEQ